MIKLSILGSTGSIGTNTLEVVRKFPERFRLRALAAGKNVALLARQIAEFKPDIACVQNAALAGELAGLLPSGLRVEILHGDAGYAAAASEPSVDTVVSAMVGAAGLMPTLAAIEAGKRVALANKETLVMAGEIVMAKAAEKNVELLPVDSEHSAIFQCLAGQRMDDFSKILLTASGGPFRTRPFDTFHTIGLSDALSHPTWQMGRKISIDSATLMNKGLEVIEAKYLFGIPEKQIEVLVHPQSIVHSMVAYRDGSVIAQLGVPHMMGAIAYAISYPERLDIQQPIPDFAALSGLTFEKPDYEKFPALRLAFEAADAGGALPAVMNAANEIAVAGFLDEKIPFTAIPVLIEETMAAHIPISAPGLNEIVAADGWAREFAGTLIGRFTP